MKKLVIRSQDNGERIYTYTETEEPEVFEQGHVFTVYYSTEDEDGEVIDVSCDYETSKYYYEWKN